MGTCWWWERTESQAFLAKMYAGALEVGELEKLPFRLLCVFQSQNVKRSDAAKERLGLMQTFRVPPEIQQCVWTTTNSALQSALDCANINEPIWHRGKDLLAHRSKWHNCTTRGHTRFMQELMDDLPTYSLFP